MNHTIKAEFIQNLKLLKKLAATKSQKTKTHLIYIGDESTNVKAFKLFVGKSLEGNFRN